MFQCRNYKFLLLALLMPMAVQAQSFTELTDIPFMDGRVESTDDWVQFDSPEGHIIQTRAYVNGKDKEDIIDFYRETLPAVGWIYDAKARNFTRDEDILTVTFERDGNKLFTLFEIKTK